MTAYTNHPDAIFDPDKPILGSTHLEARDNLIAAMEGDPTAPNVYEALAARLVSGALGSWVFARHTGGDRSYGNLVAGSSLRPTGAARGVSVQGSSTTGGLNTNFAENGGLSGTWMCLGRYDDSVTDDQSGGGSTVNLTIRGATLWMRTL